MDKPIHLRIASLGFGGEGLATHQGKRVVVAHGLPGEEVEAEIIRQKPYKAPRLKIRRLLVPSPDRIDPDCSWYDVCPGCHLRHISYAKELEFKQASVAQAMTRFAGASPHCVAPTVPALSRNGYRIRASGTFTDGRITLPGLGPGDPPVPLAQCPAQHPRAQEEILNLEKQYQEQRVESQHGPPSAQDTMHPLEGRIEVDASITHGNYGREVVVGGIPLCVGESSWTLPNPSMAFSLRETVLDLLQIEAGMKIIEIGSGIGGLTVPMARAGGEVVAMDIDLATLNALKSNVQRHGLEASVHVRAGLIQRVWPRVLASHGPVDVAVCNPMRQPLGEQTMAALVERLGAKRLIYVGPSPVPAARDLKHLVDRGWQVSRVVPLDLYPGTYHVLTIAQVLVPSD